MLTGKHEVVYSYGWYMRRYVEETKAAGATPVVLSLVPGNTWKDGRVARSSPEGYGAWAREVAAATGAVFMDHNEIIASGLELLGQEKAKAFFADRLHATVEGARFNARMAVAGLKAVPGNPLGNSCPRRAKCACLYTEIRRWKR